MINCSEKIIDLPSYTTVMIVVVNDVAALHQTLSARPPCPPTVMAWPTSPLASLSAVLLLLLSLLCDVTRAQGCPKECSCIGTFVSCYQFTEDSLNNLPTNLDTLILHGGRSTHSRKASPSGSLRSRCWRSSPLKCRPSPTGRSPE